MSRSFAQKVIGRLLRLCRLMCGEAVPRRSHATNREGFAPRSGSALRFLGQRPNARHSRHEGSTFSARQSHAAHPAAKPLRTEFLSSRKSAL